MACKRFVGSIPIASTPPSPPPPDQDSYRFDRGRREVRCRHDRLADDVVVVLVNAGPERCAAPHSVRDDVAVGDSGSSVGDFSQGHIDAARTEARLLREEATIRHSAVELRRAEATRQRAQSLHERADAASQRAMAARDRAKYVLEQFNGLHGPEAEDRESIADHRDAKASPQERILRRRDSAAGERARKADRRQLPEQIHRSAHDARRATDQAESLSRTSLRLGDQVERLRAESADLTARIAEQADAVASYFENHGTRGDTELRLAIAKTEHEIARLGRQNAAKLRDLKTRYKRGDNLPRFPTRPSVSPD